MTHPNLTAGNCSELWCRDGVGVGVGLLQIFLKYFSFPFPFAHFFHLIPTPSANISSGMASPGKRLLVLESSGNLFN